MDTPDPGLIEFREAGHDVMLAQVAERWWLDIRLNGELVAVDEQPTLDAACAKLDQWFEGNTKPKDRFKGLVGFVRDHETNMDQIVAYRTRGSLLPMFENGSIPSVPEFIDHLKSGGDTVLRVTDGAGTVLWPDPTAAQQVTKEFRFFPPGSEVWACSFVDWREAFRVRIGLVTIIESQGGSKLHYGMTPLDPAAIRREGSSMLYDEEVFATQAAALSYGEQRIAAIQQRMRASNPLEPQS